MYCLTRQTEWTAEVRCLCQDNERTGIFGKNQTVQPLIVSAITISSFPRSLSRRHDVFCGSVQKATVLGSNQRAAAVSQTVSVRISSMPSRCAKCRACLALRARTMQATMASYCISSVMSRRIYSRVGAALRVEEERPLRWVRRAELFRGARVLVDAWVIRIRWRFVQRRYFKSPRKFG